MVLLLQSRSDVNPHRVGAIGIGRMGPALLHAAAFDQSISRLALVESPLSYERIVLNRYYRPEFVHSVVPGALRQYDLPDLAAAFAPRRLLVLNAVDHWGRRVSVNDTQGTYHVTQEATERIAVRRTGPSESWVEVACDWLQARNR